MKEVEKYLEEIPKKKKRRMKLNDYRNEIQALRDNNCSLLQIQDFLIQYKKIKVSISTICIFLKTQPKQNIESKNSVTKNIQKKAKDNHISDQDFKKLTSDKQVCYCFKMYKEGDVKEAERLIQITDSVTRAQFRNALKNAWFDC
ncbi:hypothetical protein [Sulfurospirillum sp. 1612]|uniref:hypothetical protein n=1 Tax=Sulfurospirillum sp. 1612 TaxID=3094835 RepID=UPI002F9356C6